jgi:hypothetical protein
MPTDDPTTSRELARARARRYRQSEKGKAAHAKSDAKYRATAKAKERARERSLKYSRTAAGKENNETRRRGIKARLNAIKLERVCVDCGYRAHPAALHFDHLPGSRKVFAVGRARCTWDRIEAEIAKCEVVCANCHAIRTEGRRGPSPPVRIADK